MKTKGKRALALGLALTLMLALPVYAAGNSLNYSVYDVKAEAGYTLTPQTADGTADTAVPEDVNDDGVSDSAYKNTVKFALTFSGEVGTQYVVFLLSDGAKIPTESTIRYIDQKGMGTAVSVVFTIYPDTLEKAGDYTVFLSSSGANGAYSQVASFKVEPLYTLGDVNQDGFITAYDASLILQYAAEMIDLTETQKLAADTSRGDGITAYDASLILQYAAEIIPGF